MSVLKVIYFTESIGFYLKYFFEIMLLCTTFMEKSNIYVQFYKFLNCSQNLTFVDALVSDLTYMQECNIKF